MTSMVSSRRFLPRTMKLVALALVGLGASALGVLSASGCSSPPAQPPKPCDVQIVTLNIYAADNINPNEKGNPRPVVVRLYQLKTEVAMENATYDDILLKDKDTLGEDMMKRDEFEVFPNDLVQVKFERMKEATSLAGVALFRTPKGNSWKTFYAFPPIPAEAAACGARGGGDGGVKPEADPKTSFFIESTKIDNGSQFDESMFPNSTNIRKIDLPKKSASSEPAGAGAPAPK
jgi:type VI secretion system protein VasD